MHLVTRSAAYIRATYLYHSTRYQGKGKSNNSLHPGQLFLNVEGLKRNTETHTSHPHSYVTLSSATNVLSPLQVSSHISALYSHPCSAEQCSHNALVLCDAMAHIGLTYDCQVCHPSGIPSPTYIHSCVCGLESRNFE